MKSLYLHWTNKASRNYVDILPMSLFQAEVRRKEIEHQIRRPNGTAYSVRSHMNVNANIATLSYSEQNNLPDAVWFGTTRITFSTDDRTTVQLVEWKDEKGNAFSDAEPIHYITEHEGATRYHVIKTSDVEERAESLVVSARPITSMNGHSISVGDQTFVWDLKDGVAGSIEWLGLVQTIDRSSSNKYRIQLGNLRKAASNFGTKEIDDFVTSENAAERSLFQKLKTYSLGGIRHIQHDEADRLLALFDLDIFSREGNDEVARLMRLANVAIRPKQGSFSANVRKLYDGQCAVTGCIVGQAIEAAHISVADGVDDRAGPGILHKALSGVSA